MASAFIRHDDEVALHSFKNLFFYNSVYLLRLYGRDERKYEKEKRHHHKRRHQEGQKDSRRDQIILSEAGLSVYQWASRWVTEQNNTIEEGYLLHSKLQKIIRDMYLGMEYVRGHMTKFGPCSAQFSLHNVYIFTDQDEPQAKVSKVIMGAREDLNEKETDVYQFMDTSRSLLILCLNRSRSESIPQGLDYCFEQELHIQFEYNPELLTPIKRNLYRAIALKEVRGLQDTTLFLLEDEMNDILQVDRYGTWREKILEGDSIEEFEDHLSYDPETKSQSQIAQYGETTQEFLRFSRNLIEHKPEGWSDEDVDRHLSEHEPLFMAALHVCLCRINIFVTDL